MAWSFIGIALLSSLLYAFILIAMVVGAYRSLSQKHKSLIHMSQSAKLRYESMFIQWKFFLCLTIFVAALSVGSLFLPSTILLHWQQGKSYFSYYTALQTGNYGLWNAYVLLMVFMYAPQRKGEEVIKDDQDIAVACKFIAKQSQE